MLAMLNTVTELAAGIFRTSIPYIMHQYGRPGIMAIVKFPLALVLSWIEGQYNQVTALQVLMVE